MLLLLLPTPYFWTSKSPLRKSPNLQIANPLYLCRFPDDSGRQATTDYSGLNPPSPLPVFHDHFAEWSEEVGAVSLGRSSRLAYIFFGPIDRISVQLQSKTA